VAAVATAADADKASNEAAAVAAAAARHIAMDANKAKQLEKAQRKKAAKAAAAAVAAAKAAANDGATTSQTTTTTTTTAASLAAAAAVVHDPTAPLSPADAASLRAKLSRPVALLAVANAFKMPRVLVFCRTRDDW
jgi:hypothetical protein